MDSSVNITKRIFRESVFTSTEKNNVFITEDPIAEEISRKYILAAGGIIIVMFLFVLILQLYICKRSKSSNIKSFKQRRSEKIPTHDQPVNNAQHENEPAANSQSPVRNKNNVNLTVESDYHDIDELLELRGMSSLSNTIEDYEKPPILSSTKLSYYPLTVRNMCFQDFNDQYVEPVSGHSDENNADLYLQPVNV